MLHIRLLGTVDLRGSDGQPIRALLVLPKRIAVLTYLLIARPRGFWRRDKLLALFWPESDAEHARGSLRVSVHRLRASLGEDVVIGRGKEEIGIAFEQVWCDVICFETMMAQGRLAEALELYRGDLLAGFFAPGVAPELEHWIEDERARLRDLATQAATALVTEAQASGSAAEAERWARRTLELSPANEAALRVLVQLLVENGNRAEVSVVFDRFAQRLHQLHGLDPSTETRQLMKDLLRDEASAGAATRNTAVRMSPPASLRLDVSALSSMKSVLWRSRTILAAAPVLAIFAVLIVARLTSRHTSASSETANGSPAGLTRADLVGFAPLGRQQHSAVLDAKHGNMLVVGGRQSGEIFSDVWSLELPHGKGATSWIHMPTTAPPQARWGHSTVYDSVSDRIIMFGGALGFSAPCSDEVWLLLNVSRRYGSISWRRVAIMGEQPTPRANHAAAYDDVHHRMFVFGGHDCIGPRSADVWVLDNADGARGTPRWRRLPLPKTGGPVGRSNHVMGYDPVADRLIVYGGVTPDGTMLDDAWVLSSASGIGRTPRWRQLELRGVTPKKEFPDFYASTYDAAGRRFIVVRGSHAAALPRLAVSLLDVSRANATSGAWRRVAAPASGPVPLWSATAVYDRGTQQLVIFGGGIDGAERHDTWTMRVSRSHP